jgi:hypothetical protein
LYEKGWEREQILLVFHFVDWLMRLPTGKEVVVWEEIDKIEGEKHMPYVTSFERLAKEEGREEGRREGNIGAIQEAILEALSIRFGSVPRGVSETVQRVTDLSALKPLHRQAITVSSLQDFVQALGESTAQPSSLTRTTFLGTLALGDD